MINYHQQIVSALSKVLPTHYEMALTSNTQTPCISYMETNNYELAETIGATLSYSRITYQIKVWSTDIAEIQDYSLQVDDSMRSLGFKRVSSGELYDNNSAMIQKIMTYEAVKSQKFKEEF